MALTTEDPTLLALAERYKQDGDDRWWISMYVDEGFYIDTYGEHPGMEGQEVIIYVTPERVEVSMLMDTPNEDGEVETFLGDRFVLGHDEMLTYLRTLPKPLFQYDVTRIDPFTDQ